MVLSKRILQIASLVALALAAGALWAHAQHGGTISACYTRNGAVRIVQDVTMCKDRETPLEWNIEGPAGPIGPRGTQGPEGPPGVLGFYNVVNRDIPAPPGTTIGVANCDPGDHVTGGGFDLWDTGLDLIWSMTDTEDSWLVRVSNSLDSGVLFDVYAVCADLAP